MIDRLIYALRDAGLDVDWRDLSDALWLAQVTGPQANPSIAATPDTGSDPPNAGESGPRQPSEISADADPGDRALTAGGDGTGLRRAADGERGATAFDIRAPERYALPGRLGIGRALRPFKQRRRSPRDRMFDTDATIDAYCQTRVLVPITSLAPERWFRDVAVVADGGPTMVIWRATIAALTDLLEHHGAFERVTQWSLAEDTGGVVLRTHGGGSHSPREVVDQDGRRLTLVISDCVAPMWRRAAVWEALRAWGRSNPVVLVQTLPPRLWPSTALGDADVVLAPHRRGEPNQRLELRAPWWWDEDHPPEQALPVVTLDEERLGTWARMVMGDAEVHLAGVVTQPPEPEPDEAAVPERLDAAALVSTFRATVSDEASELATLLSAVDVTLPVARLVLNELIPEPRLTYLAELLAGGLLRPLGGEAYEFAAGVRELLQESLTATATIGVWRAVTPYMEATTGTRPPFSLLLSSDLPAAASPLGDIAAGLIRRLGLKTPRLSLPTAGTENRILPDARESSPGHAQAANTESSEQVSDAELVSWLATTIPGVRERIPRLSELTYLEVAGGPKAGRRARTLYPT